MARNARLLIVAAAAALAAAPAAGADHASAYRATLTGRITAQWTFAPSPTTTAEGCTVADSHNGTRTVVFRTAKPTLVAVRGGVLAPRNLAPLVGKTTTVGSELRSVTCPSQETQDTPTDCFRTVRSFSHARTRLATRPRALSLGPLGRAFVSQPLSCPTAPPGGELRRAPALGAVRISLAHVVRATRVVVPGGYEATRDLGDGELTWSVRWTLTLRRVGP